MSANGSNSRGSANSLTENTQFLVGEVILPKSLEAGHLKAQGYLFQSGNWRSYLPSTLSVPCRRIHESPNLRRRELRRQSILRLGRWPFRRAFLPRQQGEDRPCGDPDRHPRLFGNLRINTL